MMRALAAAALAIAFLSAAVHARQSSEIEVTLEPSSARIGDHLQLTVRLILPPGQSPEFAPGTAGWGAVELVSLQPPRQSGTSAAGTAWVLEATVAPFALGDLAFSPTIAVVSGSEVRTVDPSPVTVAVLPTLLPDAPLELSPLPPPVVIAGAESPLLRPALAAAAAAAGLLLVALALTLIRRLSRRPAPVPGPPPPADPALPGLLAAESAIDTDPVAAYRALGSAVRAELARRFGIPATALTAAELRARLESAGADRWVARLAGGLLEECDAVVYAGYRPAPERRRADLAMAYELVGEP
ncbi:MAG: hypothetical protein KatS3mg062_1034 [Tepidiforma sp.]|nr:MAG: hypothetical protein KatS3mg062_1034 [Tepidiforma sp.]